MHHIWCSAARPPPPSPTQWYHPPPTSPPPPRWFPVVLVPPCPSPLWLRSAPLPWLLLVGRPVAKGLDLRMCTWLGMTTVDTVFARTSQAKHDFQLSKAMNMRCRSPKQHKSKGTTNSHTGNSTSTSFVHNTVAISEGEGKRKGPCGSLCCGSSFPTPPLWFPSMCCGLSFSPPPVC